MKNKCVVTADLVNGAGDYGDGDGWQGSHDPFSGEPPQESSGDSYWSALVLDHSPAMPGCGSCGSYGKKGSCLYISEPCSSLEATKTSWDTSKLPFAASFTNQGHKSGTFHTQKMPNSVSAILTSVARHILPAWRFQHFLHSAFSAGKASDGLIDLIIASSIAIVRMLKHAIPSLAVCTISARLPLESILRQTPFSLIWRYLASGPNLPQLW